MNYIGTDLHRDNFQAVVLDRAGKVQHIKKYDNTIESVDTLLAKCSKERKAVVEATLNWMWLVSALQNRQYHVKLAHPLKTKAIVSAKIKNDTIDATTLANLLRIDYVPDSHNTLLSTT